MKEKEKRFFVETAAVLGIDPEKYLQEKEPKKAKKETNKEAKE